MIKISTIENVCYAPNKNDNFFIKIENACYKKVGGEKMPIISMKNLYRNAMRESYILGAFNVFNCDTLKAVLDVAQSVQSPVIVQISMG
ncbi:fructose-bisphosphate aldolase [Lachnospiraceae bacterium]|nr:fructose-bisphosphate aldolase [Lachnospiraceae bacterium]